MTGTRELIEKAKGGVQSVEIGLQLLKSLVALRDPITLRKLAATASLHPAKAHRYLTSLVKAGFVTRTAYGRYAPGPYLLELSTKYLRHLDPAAIANPVIDRLNSESREGVVLCVWSDAGTTVVRWKQALPPVHVRMRPGAIFSPLMSASGRVFISYLPEELSQRVVRAELSRLATNPHPLAPRSMHDVERMISEVRRRTLAYVEGHTLDYVSAIAAPIFDYRDDIQMTMAIFGHRSHLDTHWNGLHATMLRAAAAEVSRKLGYVKTE